MQDILDGYAAAATPAFVTAYDVLSPESIYEHVVDLFPTRASRVADVGAGTGRDAAWFAEKGHEVVAIEPVRELREAARSLHQSDRIKWLNDRLPHLAEATCLPPFDLVMLGAVWQHLTDEARILAMPNLARMTAPGSLLVMSLRHGPGAKGRRVFPVAVDATIHLGEEAGFVLVRRREADSIQAANKAMGVCWTWLAFERIA